MSSTLSLNNRIIVETYKKEGLRAEIKNGFALLAQKITHKGLKVLVDAKLADGTFITKGSMAYFREETLHTAQWAMKPLTCPIIESEYLVADIAHVDFVNSEIE